MTAREKFEARLKELGLYDDYMRVDDMVGKVMEDGSIVILSHYGHDPQDPYYETHYPSFDELWENEDFRENCADDFFYSDDDKFVAQLARWLQYGPGINKQKCPLFPVDVYFIADDLKTGSIKFEDDPELELGGVRWTRIPKDSLPDADPEWWSVVAFTEGHLWMNNSSGLMVLQLPDKNYDLISSI